MDSGSVPFDDDSTVCFCHFVSRGRIIQAIEAGAETLQDIRLETCASTGCGGCEFEVLEILEETLAKKKASSPAKS